MFDNQFESSVETKGYQTLSRVESLSVEFESSVETKGYQTAL